MADQELIKAIENKAGFTGSALNAATVLTKAAESAMKHYTGGDMSFRLRVFNGGAWNSVLIPLNIAQGDVAEKAIAKALVGAFTGVLIGAAAAALTVGAPFIITFGVGLAFATYAGGKINEVVDGTYENKGVR